jgi:tetratricopeptide (TPR) repeat protein
MSMRLFLPLALVLPALVLVPASSALAQGKKPPAGAKDPKDPKLAEAKKLFDDGRAAYGLGNYEQAIDLWLKSYELSQKPLIYDSVANAYERLGDPKKARDYLAKWREAAPAEEHEMLDQRLKNLDARIAKDDEREAQRKADEDKARAAARNTGGDVTKPGGDPAPRKMTSPTAGYALLAGGGAVVAIGVVLDVIAFSTRPKADEVCKASPDGSTYCRDTSQGSIGTSNALARVGDISVLVGAVAAGAGLVLVLTHKPKPKDSAPIAAWATPYVAPTSAGATITGRF